MLHFITTQSQNCIVIVLKVLFLAPSPQINLKKSDQINLLSKRARAVQENHVAVQPAAGPVPHRPGQGHLHWRPLQAQHGPTEAALQEYPSHQRFLSGIS